MHREARQRGSIAGRPDRAILAAVLVAAAATLGGCAAGGVPGPGATFGEDGTALPSISEELGPVELRVEYPDSLALVAVSDSNFLFGSVGTGDARLTVDGVEVEVEPNGAFLAWLPVPESSRGDTAEYRLVARRDGEADTLRHPVLRPSPPRPDTGGTWIDTASVRLPSERWALPDEELEVSVEAAPGLEAWLCASGLRVPLRETASGRYGGSVSAADLRAAGRASGDASRPEGAESEAACRAPPRDSTAQPVATGEVDVSAGTPVPPPDTVAVRLTVAGAADTVRHESSAVVRVLDPADLPVARLVQAPDSVHGRRGVVVGRPAPYGTYAWQFPDGTRARVEGRAGDRLRLRIGADQRAWVTAEDAEILASGTDAPRSVVGAVRVEPTDDRLRIRVHAGAPLPVEVVQPGPRTLEVVLYGGRSGTERMSYGRLDPLLRQLTWRQLPGERWRLRVELAEPVWGWRASWEGLDASGARASPSVLRLDVRRPPPIDPGAPLRGRRIAVDAGHPPVGAYGPTGYYEGDANLAVARELAAMLEEAGATPILVRDDTGSVGLYERTDRADRAGAELFVSIHNNALPDGVRPFGREGTSTYHFHRHARDLAFAVQRGMLEGMGLRDLGVYWGNLAVARATWMPSVLAEGAFMMMPRHEAALRTTSFRRAYARGVLEGIRSFLADRAAEGTFPRP